MARRTVPVGPGPRLAGHPTNLPYAGAMPTQDLPAHQPHGLDEGPWLEPDPTVCVVIPMYNEGSVIGGVVANVRRQFPHVVCVDDGSRDDSADVAADAGALVVRHAINLGQGAALQTGIEMALTDPSVELIVTFDADGQHRVADAVRLVQLAREEKVQAVLGSRFLEEGPTVPWSRRLVLRAAVTFTRVTTGLKVTDTHNGLRVLHRDAAAAIRITHAGMAHASEILHEIARNGFSYQEIPVQIDYTEYSRAKGQSNLNAVNILHDLISARIRSAR